MDLLPIFEELSVSETYYKICAETNYQIFMKFKWDNFGTPFVQKILEIRLQMKELLFYTRTHIKT